MHKTKKIIIPLLLFITFLITACTNISMTNTQDNIDLNNIPEFSDKPFVEVNNNIPYFNDNDLTTKAFEYYSDLDKLGRCQSAFANVCKETMPTEKRGNIGMIKPTGWQTVKYDFVDGKYLYNRCHLIGYQLTAENANEKNLITGTRYLNVNGMLPFENIVADYVKETGNHVLYRVTPIFKDNEMVARGVLMEAESVEDNGEGILYNVFVYNNQPGVTINYNDGKSKLNSNTNIINSSTKKDSNKYIINKKTKKFHLQNCSSVKDIKNENKEIYKGNKNKLKTQGYTPCSKCNP